MARNVNKNLGILINIIPTILIKRFVQEINEYGKFNGLCNFIADMSFCEIPSEKEYGYYINNNYNIVYNKHYKDPELKNGDVIIRINNKKITKHGQIYSNQIGRHIPISTFIALKYFMDTDYRIKTS